MAAGKKTRHRAGCMVCGEPLVYLDRAEERACSFCGETLAANAACAAGHFVCDDCHAADARAVIERICLSTNETDMVALLCAIREHPAIPIHGPEHHGMVPGIILATYRNRGGDITDDQIRDAIGRGFAIPGGFCGFAGTCGAATGVGVAFAAILESNPLNPKGRRASIETVSEVLWRLAEKDAARCCQRDSFLALKAAADLSKRRLPIALRADADLACRQMRHNKECIKKDCPLWRGSPR